VRDTSLSSNEGTGTFTGIGGTRGVQGASGGSIDGAGDEAVGQAYKYDRIKAGFNVSYDSNSF